ncbi:MAG: hypothetical protein ACKOXJ_07935 [Alphaproteobacteria bacterium]
MIPKSFRKSLSKFLRGLPDKIYDLCDRFAKIFEDDNDKITVRKKPEKKNTKPTGDGQTFFPGPRRTLSTREMTDGQLEKAVDRDNNILTKGPNHKIKDHGKGFREKAEEELERRKKGGTYMGKGR